jgi:uncharacterized membrane-anchored protein
MAIVFPTLNHPLRVPLSAEIHSRPPIRLEAPERITHLGIFGRNEPEENKTVGVQTQLLADLCIHFGVTPPVVEAKYFFHDFGRFRLKWEGHSEFSSFTFVSSVHGDSKPEGLFERMPSEDLPQDWLLRLQGKLMVATHIVLESGAMPSDEAVPHMRRLFEGNPIAGCEASQAAQVWTDFQIHASGFVRFVIRDAGLKGQQAGRLVQRILEIETYRKMAMLGLPNAQRASPILNIIEAELASQTAAMVDMDKTGHKGDEEGMAEEQLLLERITSLAARLEQLAVDNSYRFSASNAYFKLVHSRIEELRERRIEGVPTISEFMQRRLTPAMNTCLSTDRRQKTLAERIANTNSLLRTRVGIRQEQQNNQILQSMNKRAAQQLRLQQAVEGLSVVAISYYLAGLVSYAGKALKAAGLHIDTDLVTGISLPVLALIVWLGLKQMKKNLN